MFQSFQNDSDLRIRVMCHWDTMAVMRGDRELDATTTYNGKEWTTELRLRGKFRLMNCDTMIRPFRLQFKKKELRNAGLVEYRNHKIVTPCIANEEGIENLLEEKLVYQLYAILTDSSFRYVQGTLERTWPDDIRDQQDIPILVLEPNDEMADRLGGKEIEKYYYPADSVDPWSYNLTAMFQFMVGNFDWDLTLLKNVKLIMKDNDKVVIVPYDFDFSEIVAPSYRRVPMPYLELYSRYKRVYQGVYFMDQLDETKQYFISHKRAVMDAINSYDGLSKTRIKRIAKYIEGFYTIIEKDHDIARYTIPTQ